MLRITKLPLIPAPTVNTLCSLWAKFDAGGYTLLSTNITVRPNGELVTPYLLAYPAGAQSVTIMAKSNCGDDFFEKQIPLPQAAPVTTTTTLPVVTWQPATKRCETQKGCPAGYTLSPDGTNCTKVEDIAPTSQEAPINAAPSTNTVYSQYGTKLYLGTWDALGNGDATVLSHDYWKNNVPYAETKGPMNKNGIWIDNNGDGIRDALVAGAKLNVSVKILSSSAKDFFIGIGGDNQVKLTVNGTTIVDKNQPANDHNFKWWHVYRIPFRAGDNIITVTGTGDGSTQDSVAMVIYENTAAELQAAVSDATLNIRFKTADVRGGVIRITNCPAGYQAINDGGVWKCQRILSQPAAVVNTGKQIVDTRRRLVNGVADGYIEANDQDGEGPYFPTVMNMTECPVGAPAVVTTTTLPPTTTVPPTTTTTTQPPTPAHLNPLNYSPVSGSIGINSCDVEISYVTRNAAAMSAHTTGIVRATVRWTSDSGCQVNQSYDFAAGIAQSNTVSLNLNCNGACSQVGWEIIGLTHIP